MLRYHYEEAKHYDIMKNNGIKEAIRLELENTRFAFHEILNSLSKEDWYRKSQFPAWTNGELLFHMTFGFIILPTLINLVLFWTRLPKSFSKLFAGILNFFTDAFERIDILGPHIGAKVFPYKSIGEKYDRVYFSILKKLDSIKKDDWQRGMYYPTKWDPLFSEYMTVEAVFHYMTSHFNYHLKQLSL